jgi:pilin like competence factor
MQNPNFSNQQGFTLIELMIAITLGLIVTAAALMMFLSSQRSLAMQNGLSSIQQNATFGLTNVAKDLRHINLDSGSDFVSHSNSESGIVFQIRDGVGPNQVTKAEFAKPGSEQGIMTPNSDQLTIRYVNRKNNTMNCEGVIVEQDKEIIQRYYIDKLPDVQQNQGDTRYGLFCEVLDEKRTGRAVAIADAESFKVSVVTRDFNGTPADRKDDILRYQTLKEYIAAPTGDAVVAVEIGVVIRSSGSVHADSSINANPTFTIAGQEVKLSNPPSTASHLRVPVTQMVAIRNSQGVE